jgi:hypothetical protein
MAFKLFESRVLRQMRYAWRTTRQSDACAWQLPESRVDVDVVCFLVTERRDDRARLPDKGRITVPST